VLDYDESPFTPPDTVSTARAVNYHRVVASPSSIQVARERLRRSFEETEAVNRVDSVMASRSRFQARTGGSESVISLAGLAEIYGWLSTKSGLNCTKNIRQHAKTIEGTNKS